GHDDELDASLADRIRVAQDAVERGGGAGGLRADLKSGDGGAAHSGPVYLELLAQRWSCASRSSAIPAPANRRSQVGSRVRVRCRCSIWIPSRGSRARSRWLAIRRLPRVMYTPSARRAMSGSSKGVTRDSYALLSPTH